MFSLGRSPTITCSPFTVFSHEVRPLSTFGPQAAQELGGADWLVSRRVTSAEHFATTEAPSDEQEVWRYTPIEELTLDDFAPTSDTSGNALAVFDSITPRAGLVEVRNGWVTRHECDEAVAAQGVFVGRVVDHPDAEELLGSVVGQSPDTDYFTSLNDAFVGDAVVIDVPAGVVVENPIVVGSRAKGDNIAAFNRLIVRVGENAEVSVVEHTSSGAGNMLVVPVTELDVGAAARLNYLSIQSLGSDAWQIGNLAARIGADGTATIGAAGLGGSYARLRLDCQMAGQRSSSKIMALYYGEADQTLDYRTFQDHVAANTTSELLFKGALADEARSIYSGLILVRPDARGTNAEQTNKIIKLSDKAWAESVPNLEIENNDVRCSHASTVSPIDEEQMFYLESRGVPTKTAERLIIAGFFNDVVSRLPINAADDLIGDAVTAKQDRHQNRAVESADEA